MAIKEVQRGFKGSILPEVHEAARILKNHGNIPKKLLVNENTWDRLICEIGHSYYGCETMMLKGKLSYKVLIYSDYVNIKVDNKIEDNRFYLKT